MATLRSIVVFLALTNLAAAQTPQAEAPVTPRAPFNIEFIGNSYYDAGSLRIGLMLDRAIQIANDDQLNAEINAELIRRRILRGYLNDGFRDVKVSTVAKDAAQTFTATIEEGVRWKQRHVIVRGLSPRECEYVGSLLKHNSKSENPLQKSQPALTYWSENSAMSFLTSTQSAYEKSVAVAIAEIGYPEAEFKIAFPASSEGDKHFVDLEIDVTAVGSSLTIGEINFTGLEKHTPEQMLEFLELKSGMPLSLDMQEQIVGKLLKSGRFLMAEVTHEPFLFDPAEPLDLNIRVREYDLVAPLGVELTELQQTLMKTSEWLSTWGEEGDDLHVKISASNGQAKEVIESFVPPQYHSFCDPALGTGTPGTLCVDFMTSPEIGSVMTLQVIDAQGSAFMRRTILLTSTAQGLIAWQNKKKWLQTEQVSIVCTQSILGQWHRNSDDRRAEFQFGYGFNSNPTGGLKSEFKTTAAAVIHMVNIGTPTTLFEGDLCRITWEDGEFDFSRESGAIQKISAASSEAKIEVTSGKGLVAAELARVMDETKDWENRCQPDRKWPALAAMILEDVKAVDPQDANALVLLLSLLSDEAAVKRLSKGLTLFTDRHDFSVPQERRMTTQQTQYNRFNLVMLAFSCAPVGSFFDRVQAASRVAEKTGTKDAYSDLIKDFLSEEHEGAVYCHLMAHYYRTNRASSAIFAKAGLERLSTEQFQSDAMPFITEPCVVREFICGMVIWLQGTSDENVESLASLIAKNLKDKNDQPVNIRPIVAEIRRQRDKSPEDVLSLIIPLIWEAGLRAWIEADLRILEDAAPADLKPHLSKSMRELMEAMHRPTARKKEPSKQPLITPAAFQSINFDERWDLGK